MRKVFLVSLIVTALGLAGHAVQSQDPPSVIPTTRPEMTRPPVMNLDPVPSVQKPTPTPPPPQSVSVPPPQQVPLPPPMPATSYPSPGGSTPTVDMYLLAALRAQDAKIEDLEKRIAVLEKARGGKE